MTSVRFLVLGIGVGLICHHADWQLVIGLGLAAATFLDVLINIEEGLRA